MPDCVERYLGELTQKDLKGVHTELDNLTNTVGQSRDEVRLAMAKLGQEMAKINDYMGEYDHSVINGMYRRTVFMKAGSLVETKIHTEPNFTFVMKGRARVLSDDGYAIINAPDMFITYPGTKRILEIEEDMIFVTMHPNPNNSTNFDELEDRLSVWTYEELEKRVPYLEDKP